MSIFAFTYRYTDDAAGRDEHRCRHREFLASLAERGVVLCAGPYADADEPGGLILVRAESVEQVHALLADDPFQVEGLVASAQARVWTPVLGPLAESLR